MDLSTPKVLDLSVKSNISIPQYKTNHDDQNNDKSINNLITPHNDKLYYLKET